MLRVAGFVRRIAVASFLAFAMMAFGLPEMSHAQTPRPAGEAVVPTTSKPDNIGAPLGRIDDNHAAVPATPARYRVLVIATSNVPRGKFRGIKPIAAQYGVALDARYLHQIPARSDGSLFAGYDAVFIDSYLRDSVREHLAAALPGLTQPHAWLYEDDPAYAKGLKPDAAKALIDYYRNGGEQNFHGFFALLSATLSGKPAPANLAPPVIFPDMAAYHPRAGQKVFGKVDDYLRWAGIAQTGARPPVIAVLIHQQYIGAMQTGFVDDLIARIEAKGAKPLVFYAPAMGPSSLAPWLRPHPAQPPLADALINTQIMLDAEGRRREFAAIGIPVIQAMPYRRGDEAHWRANQQGVALMDVPFYFAQPEYAGVFDIQVAATTRKGDDAVVAIPAQADAVVAKAVALAGLKRTAAADKQLALMFWNYPAGEKNLSASFMNVPRSLIATINGLRAAGYDVPPPPEEKALIGSLQRLLAPAYRDGLLPALADDGLAALLPVERYRQWLDTLPAETRNAIIGRWGKPDSSSQVIEREGRKYFVIPRLQLGKLAILPQPPRAERGGRDLERALYHSMKSDAVPSHAYLAGYLWVREEEGRKRDGLIHYGTHGTQEWMPGKERGLSVYDWPMLAIGDIPVIYPYIADNIGEAMQARRRGRAVTVSHQTPPFKPAGLYEQLTRVHDLVHQWTGQDEGAVKAKIKDDLLAAARRERILADMGWTDARATAEFPAFVEELHTHIHELAETAQPLGLHSFGTAPADLHRAGTVMLMLGRPFWDAASAYAGVPHADRDETFTVDYDKLAETAPYRLLDRFVIRREPMTGLPAPLAELLGKARAYWDAIGAQGEIPGLLGALAGHYTPTSYGGDPIKNPDAYPTGRNLYGFDPSRVPTRQAWEAGKEAAEKLIALHRQQTGKMPKKLAVSLWSVETMRHQGMLEAQALRLMGVEPVWDEGGRVMDVKLTPRGELGRPRVDVILSATGLYRDHFPNVIKQMARAVELAAASGEDDNIIAANSKRLETSLKAQGFDAKAAHNASLTRIFSSESGYYGTGLDDATLATQSWQGKAEGDRKLAELYLSKMQYAYGPDEAQWGSIPRAGEAGGKPVNLYAEQLRGTEGAVLSRTSNVYGMLTTDDPFQYLGGIALAVRHLDGKAPQLYISNLRGSGSGRMENAAQFLAKEMATRQFHPGYIKGLMAEGYAGTLQVLDATNNFWGWTAVAREIVRDDQWQEMADVYVRDKHKLGLKQWFERENPHALAQTIERMIEAERQGYWQTDRATIAELKARWQELSRRYDVRSDNSRFTDYVRQSAVAPRASSNGMPASGFGLDIPTAARAPTAPPASPASAAMSRPSTQQEPAPPTAAVRPLTQHVKGITLQRQAKAPPASTPPTVPLAGGTIILLMVLGALLQGRRERQFPELNNPIPGAYPAGPFQPAPSFS